MKELDFSKNDELNSKKSISISAALGMLAKPADQQQMLDNTYKKHFDNPESEYYHLTKEQIKEIWENKGAKSRQYGSLLDDYIGVRLTGTDSDMEMYKLDNDVEGDERLNGLISSFDSFYERLMQNGEMEFITREQPIYYKLGTNFDDEEYCVQGRFDALFRNKKTGKWVIIDWKTSKSIDTSNKWEKLLGPAKNLDACNHNTYTIQGYFYKTALLNGYLPEGTGEDDVEFLIVQLPGFSVGENGENFKIWKPAFKYDFDFMNKIFEFAVKKKILMSK